MNAVWVDFIHVSAVPKEPQARRVGARNGNRWCHMWSDDVEALHKIADKIGMRREWFQDKHSRLTGHFPHYDLTPSRRVEALKHGCIERELSDWIRERLKIKHSKQ